MSRVNVCKKSFLPQINLGVGSSLRLQAPSTPSTQKTLDNSTPEAGGTVTGTFLAFASAAGLTGGAVEDAAAGV